MKTSLRTVAILVMILAANSARGEVALSILASFQGTNGNFPETRLVQGANGNFYGTTHFGGTNGLPLGYGTVFQITTNGTLTSLASFAKTNGSQPMAGLVQGGDGSFYGTTHGEPSPPYNYGTVFKVTTNGMLTTLVSFNGLNGANPQGGLIQGNDDNFYGTTSRGGTNNYGTVFKMTPDGTLTTLVSFNNSNGGAPNGDLISDGNGTFYGTTASGGANGNYGTVFKVATNGTLTTLASFGNTNGARPFASLVQGNDGNLYGTTRDGGTNGNNGTVFMVTTNGTLTTLAHFDSTNGSQPYSELIQGGDGNFYGTTSFGGTSNLGTVFLMTPTGVISALVSFAGTNGAHSYAGLVQGSDGNFYGLTANGGTSGNGTAFRFSVPLLIDSVNQTNGIITFTWSAIAGRTYQVQYLSDLRSTNWSELGVATIATNSTMTSSDSIDPISERFYRIVLLP